MKSQKFISLYISISMIILTQFANSEKINNIKKEFEIQIKQTGAEINSEKRKLEEEENYILAYFQKDLGDFYWEGKREEEQEKLNGCLNSLIDNCIVPIYQENDNYTIYKIVSNTWDVDYEYFFSKIFEINVDKLILVDFSNSKDIRPKSLKYMFNGTYNLESIDFTNFDTSFVTVMSHIFDGCKNLISLNLLNFNTSLVTDMNSMFKDCVSLKYLDLSNFDTSLVANMSSMFSGCTSLEYLDMDNLDISLIDINNTENMFDGLENLKYFNIYNFKGNQLFLKDSYLFNHNNDLKICQRNDHYVLNNKEVKCGYFNFTSGTIEEMNYIVIHYGKDVQYKYGFAYNDNGEKNAFRNNINFIINGNHDIKINDNEEIFILEGHKIEIYFSSPLTSLESFFDKNYDPNVEYIDSIDFPHFNSSLLLNMKSFCFGCSSLKSIDLSFNTSLVTDLNSMFSGCKSLELIDFSYFDTSSVTDMSYMFFECSSLQKIDVSFFNTSLVNNMSKMFAGCESLKVLDISKFNMENIEDTNSIFMKVTNLKYLNIFNVENTYIYLTNSEIKDIHNLIICQQNNIITNSDAINQCCFYNIEKDSCESTNYMILYFSGNNFYESGFASPLINEENFVNPREKISFIIIGNNRLTKDEPFKEHSITKMELHFSSPLDNLESFFDSQYFNVENLITIDLSHFDSSSIINMSKFLKGCNNLLHIDFSNFNSSSLINISEMFNGCSSIKSLNLSSFNTPNVIDMSGLFNDCSSLEFLDISNFDMIKCTSFDDMFSNIYNIKYIDLRNFQNPKNISQSLNLIKPIYVCQKELILDKFMALNCCDYTFEKECNLIPQTFTDDSFFVGNIYSTDIEHIFTSTDKLPSSEKNEESLNNFSSDIESMDNINNNSHIIDNLEYSSNFEDNKASTTESLKENTENPPVTNEGGLESSVIKNINHTESNEIIKSTQINQNNETISNDITYSSSSMTKEELPTNTILNISITEQTTLPSIKEIIKETIIETTSESIKETIYETKNEIIKETTNEIIKETIDETINNEAINETISETFVETTKSVINQTSIMTSSLQQINTSIPEIINETNIATTREIAIPYIPYVDPNANIETNIIFLGLSHFNFFGPFFYFYIYFIPLKSSLYSEVLHFPVATLNTTEFRVLDQVSDILCTIQEEGEKRNKICYMCLDILSEKTRRIIMTPEFRFRPQNNVNLRGISPLYDEVKDNIIWSFTTKYERLFKDNVYIMENTKLININSNSFEINGIILDEQPKFGTDYLDITAYLLNDTRVKIGCNVNKESQTNYTLKCMWNQNVKIKLDTPIAFIDDENILLIYFGNGSSIVTYEVNLNGNSFNAKKNKSGGLKTGVIVAIVISSVIGAITISLIVIFFLRRKRKNDLTIDSTTSLSHLPTLKPEEFKV